MTSELNNNNFYGNIFRKLLEVVIKQSNTADPGLEELNDDSTYLGELVRKERHEEYLWLLVINLLIFIGLTVSTYISSKKLSATATNPDDFRPKFIRGLIWANGIRALSLVFIIIVDNSSGNNPTSWFNYLLHIFPAFVFVSAYMYLVSFLADLYYSNVDYNNHLAKPALLLVVVSAYIILALMALMTFATQAFKSFAYISEFLMGVVYLIMGSMIIYYGEKISMIFSSKGRGPHDPANDMSAKLKILSQSIGGLFLVKSLSGFLSSMKVFGDYYPVSIGANVWDFFWFLITEIAPTVIFIIVARKRESTQVINEYTPRPSDIEMKETPGQGTYQPPFRK